MNKSLEILCVAAIMAVTLPSCGDGKAGGPQSAPQTIEFKENAILGMLPKMYAEHIIAKNAARLAFEQRIQTETENMGDSVDHDALARLHEEHEKIEDERDGKFEEAAEAEWTRVSGGGVPFTISDAFKELLLDVGSVKIDGANRSFDIAVTAREDFTVSWDNNRYKEVWYHAVAHDGSIITEGAALLVNIAHKDSVSFKKGQSMIRAGSENGGLLGGLKLLRNTDKWMDFAGVRFIDAGERILRDPRGGER